MATIEIKDDVAMSMAAQVFSELTDEQYASLYNRVVREGKFRCNVDFSALLAKTKRSWDKGKIARAKWDSHTDHETLD